MNKIGRKGWLSGITAKLKEEASLQKEKITILTRMNIMRKADIQMKCRCDHTLISILTPLATMKNSLLGSLSKDEGRRRRRRRRQRGRHKTMI